MDDSLDGLAKAAFAKVDPHAAPPKGPFWAPSLTPPVPLSWPPKGGEVVRYVYASARDPSISDGERVAAPFARIVSTQTTNRLEMLADKLAELGIQGVRPLAKSELAVPRVGDVSVDVLALAAAQGPPPAKPIERVRAAYCQWRRNNGVIGDVVRAKHAGFFTWLGCDG